MARKGSASKSRKKSRSEGGAGVGGGGGRGETGARKSRRAGVRPRAKLARTRNGRSSKAKATGLGANIAVKVRLPLSKIAVSRAKEGSQVARGRRPPPYVRLIDEAGSVGVWLVDGSYVRKNIDKEFGNVGHHYSVSAIPRDEVWLDIEQVPDEQQFLLRHALIERRLMARGMDYESARTVAIAEERKMRIKAGSAI